jgi:hypothetical protein
VNVTRVGVQGAKPLGLGPKAGKGGAHTHEETYFREMGCKGRSPFALGRPQAGGHEWRGCASCFIPVMPCRLVCTSRLRGVPFCRSARCSKPLMPWAVCRRARVFNPFMPRVVCHSSYV